MKLNTLQDLLIDQLQDLYSAKIQVEEALPKMATAASSFDLKLTLQENMKATEVQLRRLDEVFGKMGVPHDGKTCEGMQGILKESDTITRLEGDPTVRDAALIAAAQRIEQYEMAGYGSVRTFARELGYGDIADLLQETLDEENEIEKQLNTLAKGGFFSTGINQEAPR